MGRRAAIRIISGGQTGADRAALDAALERGVPCGGWCPDGRLAEDGSIPARYPLIPLPGGSYDDRTRRNVLDADATVILCFGPPFGGAETTRRACIALQKPLLVIDAAVVNADQAARQIVGFVTEHEIGVLNVAGPRVGDQPEIEPYTALAVGRALDRLSGIGPSAG
jgi:hypothetical protein